MLFRELFHKKNRDYDGQICVDVCLGKGGNMDIGSRLIEEMQINDAFVIPIFGGIHISESVFVTWIIMGVFVLLSIILTRGFTVDNPGKRQQMVEAAVTWLQGVPREILTPENHRFVPYLTSLLIFLGATNLIGIFGFKPPTRDLNVTAALAIISIVLIEAAGIKKRGFGGWLKNFTQPMAIVTPINVLEIVIKPLSLCMRLFGNVLGAFVIMKIIECVLPVGLPVVLSAYFDVFDGLIQAYVFVFLTGLYINEATE